MLLIQHILLIREIQTKIFDGFSIFISTLDLDGFSQDTGVPGLSRDGAYQSLTVVPPLDEQRAIVAFLDAETNHINTLVAKQQRMIALLKEKRKAVISHAITNCKL